MALRAGTRLGPCEVRNQLGVGSIGQVHRVTDTHLDLESKFWLNQLVDVPQRRRIVHRFEFGFDLKQLWTRRFS